LFDSDIAIQPSPSIKPAAYARISSGTEEAGHILNQRKPGSHFAKHPPELSPKIALVGGSLLLAGQTPRLARDAAKDEIHASTPGSPVECAQVIPDGRGGQPPVSLPLLDDPLAVRVSLDVADCSAETGTLECERTDAASGTYIQAIEHQLTSSRCCCLLCVTLPCLAMPEAHQA